MIKPSQWAGKQILSPQVYKGSPLNDYRPGDGSICIACRHGLAVAQRQFTYTRMGTVHAQSKSRRRSDDEARHVGGAAHYLLPARSDYTARDGAWQVKTLKEAAQVEKTDDPDEGEWRR
jgi:hypothetical protein